MKFVRYSLIAVAATAFSLAAYLTYQAETKPEEITIKVTPYSELKSAQKTRLKQMKHLKIPNVKSKA